MVGRGASLDVRLFLGGTDGSNPVPSSEESSELGPGPCRIRQVFEGVVMLPSPDGTGARGRVPELQPSRRPRKPASARHRCYASIWQESHRVSVMIRRSPIALGMVIDTLAVFASSS